LDTAPYSAEILFLVEIRYFLSPKNEEILFKGNCNAKGQLPPNSFFEPIIKAQVFVDKETPHPSLH
jgi:hypothetical protein